MPRPLVWFLIAVNLTTFLVYGWDKWCARRGRWRVSEANLLWLAFVGGLAGAWLAISFFRHKTQKGSFRWRLVLITVLNPLWLVGWYLLSS